MSALGLIITQEVLRCFHYNQFKLAISYGPIGVGKSVLAIRILIESWFHKQIRELKKKNKKWTYSDLGEEEVLNLLKTHVFFMPKQYLDYLEPFEDDLMHREIACALDDAGANLSALDWQDELVKNFGIYMNLARSRWGAIIFTSPLSDNILKRIRILPDIWTGQISRTHSQNDPSKINRWKRQVIWYQRWQHPDGRHSGVTIMARDKFNGLIDDFIYDWYAPVRASYALIYEQKLRELVRKQKKQVALA